MTKLTTARVRKLNEAGRYGDGGGLYLNVSKTGTKSWVQRVRIVGKRTDKGLGGFPSVALSEARRLADSNRVALAAGRNPWAAGRYLSEVHTEPDIPTFEQVARRFHEVNVAAGGWTNPKNISAWMGRAEKYLFPRLGGRQIDLITAAELRDQILIPVSLEKAETAKRLRIILKQVFEYAIESEYMDFNPVGRIPAKRLRRPTPKHFDAPAWQNVPAALAKVRDSEAWTATRLCFQFMTFTAARPCEARLARWDEIDTKASVWNIPASRMKSRRTHRVPLSIQASLLLSDAHKDLGHTSGLVFPAPGGQPLSENALTMRARKTADVTAHGMRSAFRDWAAERGVSWEVAELALAHCVGNATERSYFRSDLLDARRDLMQEWADFCWDIVPF